VTPSSLAQLRRRLRVYLAATLAVAIAVPIVLFVLADSTRRHDRLDASVQGAASDTLATIGEDDNHPGRIDTTTYQNTPRRRGGPLTAVIDSHAQPVVADSNLPPATRRLALRRAAAGNEAAVPVRLYGGPGRLVALPVEGANSTIGAALGYQRTNTISDQVRTTALLAAGAALAGWLLLAGLGALLIGRAVRPASDTLAREQAFLADAAHELRTPWAIVRGRAEQALREGPRPEDARLIADTAAVAGTTLADMLELAGLDAGQQLRELEPLRFDALVATCAAEREQAATAADVVLSVDAPEPVVVTGDERLLARAVFNLIDNAIRYGAAGGRVELAVAASEGRAQLAVIDYGPGIAPGQRERIFDRFHRGSTAAAAGSGLGLPIVRAVAQAHGGTVTLEAPLAGETGARFLLRLPLARGRGAPVEAPGDQGKADAP